MTALNAIELPKLGHWKRWPFRREP